MYSRGAPQDVSPDPGDRWALAGSFVAHWAKACNEQDASECDYSVRVDNLADDTDEHAGGTTSPYMTGLVVTERGGVAFIACATPTGGCRVHRRNAGEQSAVLAEGDALDPHSLLLNGVQLSWVEAGERRFSELR
jgi:hypothetical protein